jgi:ppGpp synthetase/RelA/SpoT-type nucleotidyltranferase
MNTKPPPSLQSRLTVIMSELTESLLRIPLERHQELYESISTKLGSFLRADIVSLFLKYCNTEKASPAPFVYMVASNRGSPWYKALDAHTRKGSKIEYEWGGSGTTAHIWKEGSEWICNNLADISYMRGTRQFPGKAGKYDHFVWLGNNPWSCFRNFMGIPVRIIPPVTLKPDGTRYDKPIHVVIGVLKAENKTILPGDDLEAHLREYNERRRIANKREVTIRDFEELQKVLDPEYKSDARVKDILTAVGIRGKKDAISCLGRDIESPSPGDLVETIWNQPLRVVLGDLSFPEAIATPPSPNPFPEQLLTQRETFLRILSSVTPVFDQDDMIILGQAAAYIGRLEQLRLTRFAAQMDLPLVDSHFLELPGLIDFQFLEDYRQFREDIEPVVEKLHYDLRIELRKAKLVGKSPEKVDYRTKKGESLLAKLLKPKNRVKIYKYLEEGQYVPFRQLIDLRHLDIDDIGGIRVICDFPMDCVKVAEHIRNQDHLLVLVEDIKHPEMRPEESDGRGDTAKQEGKMPESACDTSDGYPRREVTGYYASHLTLIASTNSTSAKALATLKENLSAFLCQKRSDPALRRYHRAFEKYEVTRSKLGERFNGVTFREFKEAAKDRFDHEKLLVRQFLKHEYSDVALYALERNLLRVELQIRTAQQDTWANKYHRDFYKTYNLLWGALTSRHESVNRQLKNGILEGERAELEDLLEELERHLNVLERAKRDYIATADGINEQDVKLQEASIAIDRINRWCQKAQITDERLDTRN